jgi:hypothetical protein
MLLHIEFLPWARPIFARVFLTRDLIRLIRTLRPMRSASFGKPLPSDSRSKSHCAALKMVIYQCTAVIGSISLVRGPHRHRQAPDFADRVGRPRRDGMQCRRLDEASSISLLPSSELDALGFFRQCGFSRRSMGLVRALLPTEVALGVPSTLGRGA